MQGRGAGSGGGSQQRKAGPDATAEMWRFFGVVQC